MQLKLFTPSRRPVVAAWGAGVDSTAMLVELVKSGRKPDLVLFADTGAEKPATYAFVPIFTRWLELHDVEVHTVKYEPKNFKNWPAYHTITENCLTNGTLPSISFNFSRKSCSQKWKITPQNHFVDGWKPAQECWSSDGKVVKLIGYDCSPADVRRYADVEGYDDPRYENTYPLRELGWTRQDCIARIQAEGLPVPVKSACFMCGSSQPEEIAVLSQEELRQVVLLEARAQPRLRTIKGLGGMGVKGTRGGKKRPGSWTEFIRENELLPAAEIDRIISLCPTELIRWQEAFASGRHSQTMKDWLDFFHQTAAAEPAE